MRLEWTSCSQPLAVEGCWADGPVVDRLHRRLKDFPRAGLRAAAEGSRLVLLGDRLPWVEGLVYLGRRENLYLPTLWEPNLPYTWITARLTQLGRPPWVLVPPNHVMGLSSANILS